MLSLDSGLASIVQSLERSVYGACDRLAQAERQLETAVRLVALSHQAIDAASRAQDSDAQHIAASLSRARRSGRLASDW